MIGPWKVYNKPLRRYLDSSRIIEIQDTEGNAIVHWSGFDAAPGTKKRKLSNARLMAAAPELLEALQELIFASTGLVEEKYLRDARLIITKAEGK